MKRSGSGQRHLGRLLLDLVEGGEAARYAAAEEITQILADQLAEDPSKAAELLGAAAPRLGFDLDEVKIAATGLSWLGGGTSSVERVLTDAIKTAEREVLATTFTMTFGSERVLEALEAAAGSGVRVVLVVNDISDQSEKVQAFLRGLQKTYEQSVSVYDFVSQDRRHQLHAKVLAADRTKAVVGSANLSFHGMVSAHELAAVIKGPTAAEVADRIEGVTQSGFARRLG